MVTLACFGEGLGPLRMVHRIGIKLGLQTHAAPLAIADTVLAGFSLQEVSGIQLYPRAIGDHRHGSAGFRIGEDGAGRGKYFEIVVISPLKHQRVIVLIYIPSDGLGGAEIHRCALYTAKLTGGDTFGIVRIEKAGAHGKDLIHSFFRLVVACQIEVAVVGQIEDRVLVADGIIADPQGAVRIQRIGHMDLGVSGKALIFVGAEKAQPQTVFCIKDKIMC